MHIASRVRSSRTAAFTAIAVVALVLLSSRIAWAGVPNCFVAPPDPWPAVSPAPGREPIACALLSKVLLASDETQIAWIPGAALNKTLELSTDAFPDAAYAIRFIVTPEFNAAFGGADSLVRFGSNDFDARIGSWWTVLETVTDPAGHLKDGPSIAAELALPATSVPKFEAAASAVRVGTAGYFGLVAPAFSQPGGGVQFWFPAEPVRSTAAPF
jgi:hypothetical protein